MSNNVVQVDACNLISRWPGWRRLPFSMSMQLLVSVRNANEAVLAAQSGADIIDVKEPVQGALGFAGWNTISDVVEAVSSNVPTSAALGECVEWLSLTGSKSHPLFRPSGRLSFVKLGLADLAPNSAGTNQWIDDWKAAKAEVSKCFAGDADLPDWVAVAYADSAAANAPNAFSILQAAIDLKCKVFLIDTYIKDGKTTLGWLSENQLTELRLQANAAGIRFALAGQLNEQHLEVVRRIHPDIFAVRGAVCDADRSSSISPGKVQHLKTLLQSCSPSAAGG